MSLEYFPDSKRVFSLEWPLEFLFQLRISTEFFFAGIPLGIFYGLSQDFFFLLFFQQWLLKFLQKILKYFKKVFLKFCLDQEKNYKEIFLVFFRKFFLRITPELAFKFPLKFRRIFFSLEFHLVHIPGVLCGPFSGHFLWNCLRNLSSIFPRNSQ